MGVMDWAGQALELRILILLALANLVLLLALLLRRPRGGLHPTEQLELLQGLTATVAESNQVLERSLRQEISESARGGRQEQSRALLDFQTTLSQLGAESTRTQDARLEGVSRQLVQLRGELSEQLALRLQAMGQANDQRLREMREVLTGQLDRLQEGNAAKLDEIRQTVDEKLHATLEQRLGERFRYVAERLEQVHKGLGEMQALAQGVGDLKHLLSNVKTRGIFGEVQLGQLLEQVLTPQQYATQHVTRPGTRNPVDFAIRLPGRSENEQAVWLPIDAKFPTEDYERLLDAQQRAHVADAESAAKSLEARIRSEARSIAEKYLEPPHTTDFAILFLPSEGLYAEVLRRPGLMESLQREHHVTLAGPTTLLAMLNSLQMGFRTLALERRSSEVWHVLGAVKTEFSRFGDVLARVKKQTQTVLNTLDRAEQRSRVMNRKLKDVQALPQSAAGQVLPELASHADENPHPGSTGQAICQDSAGL